MTARWTLHHGESLAWLRTLPDASVDAVVTDPPYSSGGFTRGDRTQDTTTKYVQSGTKIDRPDFAGDNRCQRSYGYWSALWLSECLRVAKPGSPICVFTDWRQLPTTTDAIQAGGWVWRGIVVWDKTRACRPAMGRFASQAEYVVWGTAGASPDKPVERDDKHHITGKPTALMQRIVAICPRGGVVLDPFAGSGTTGVAALLEGRRFLGSEQSEEYSTIARERLAAAASDVSLSAYRAGQISLLESVKP